MKRTIEIKCKPSELHEADILFNRIQKKWGKRTIADHKLIRRWIDARGRQPHYGLRYEVSDEPLAAEAPIIPRFKEVHNALAVHIIGTGPAGYFAALQCLETGFKPVLFDRGKDVRSRRRDLRNIQQHDLVNPDSNYCFGEGGAGTYSDGKLYTRSTKRGNVRKVIQLLVEHGAKPDIEIDAHPHIGSNKLPGIIASIRASIESHGGAVHFNHKLTDIIVEDGRVSGIQLNNEKEIEVDHLILATGHSARDIYELFLRRGWAIEAKAFALGVRIEHPQALIDEIQYKQRPREANLPASPYSLACEIDDRGVFSFCMCPGGLIVPAATAPAELVTNGMSLSRRDSAFANAGTVVGIQPEDLAKHGFTGVRACLDFQSRVESDFFEAGDGTQALPAQRLEDFINGRLSVDLPDCSYIPGVYSHRVDQLLPPFIYEKLTAGIRIFGRRMKGYLTNDALVVGTESRTSSPMRIPRDKSSLMHPQIHGLYPCGEGAGYAGGIMSAAVDGMRIVESISQKVLS